MTSPFPGMDPFLEISGDWRDFHTRFLSGCADALSDRLPENYVARIEEHFQILEFPSSVEEHRFPDVSIARVRPSSPPFEDLESAGAASRPAAVATIEPEIVPLVTTVVEEVKDRWIEIRRRPDWAPVAVIELLSPTNKQGQGHQDYLHKRVSLIHRAVHLVELDLLIGGRGLPMARPLRGNYRALVSRAESRPLSEVYSWSVRDPLPTVPIPLLAPDPDVPLDLAAIFQTVYRRGRYERSIDYAAPLELPLSADDRAWAEAKARARQGGPR